MQRTLFFVLLMPITVWAQVRPAPMELSLRRAVEFAVSREGNARLQFAEETIVQAESHSAQMRAALLPRVDASVVEQNLTRNLEAMGIRFTAPGFQAPSFVGPFNVFDARANLSQTILDFSSIRTFQASKQAVASTMSDRRHLEEEIAAATATAYLEALRVRAEAEAVEADVELSRAILESAEDRKSAGSGTGIDVTRARVQLSNQQQRLLVARNAENRARLQLRRLINLSLDTALDLTDTLRFVPVDPEILKNALKTAISNRSDLRSQEQREENARLVRHAAGLERLPSLAGFADYGSIGTGLTNAVPTRTYGVSLRVPLFDGGRREARRAEADSQLRQQHVRTNDLRQEIEFQVRTALDDIRSAEQQVSVAEEGFALAESELAQARRRFEAGVGTSLEVTDAQTRLERARSNRISAVFNHSRARIELGKAMGSVRDLMP
jgi:outer membrane protein TolC